MSKVRVDRPFILHLLKYCEEAKLGLNLWKIGDATWEEAMMETVKHLVLSNEELRRKLSYTRSECVF